MLEWLPRDFGYNVQTFTWLQTLALDVFIATGITWLLRTLTPLIKRLPPALKALDRWLHPQPCPRCGYEPPEVQMEREGL